MEVFLLCLFPFFVLVAFHLYFLPSFVAQGRGKANAKAIFALNLFTGWTFIGWVVALTWALTVDMVPHVMSGNEVGDYSKSPTISDDGSPAHAASQNSWTCINKESIHATHNPR